MLHQSLTTVFKKYESYLSAITLIAGFIFDFFTLERVDLFWDNFFIVSYLFLSGLCIMLINLYEEGRLRHSFFRKIYDFLPFVLQFSFGGLFSAFVIFYSKSASHFTSVAFVFVLVILLIGNEFFKKRYERLVFQIGIYFVALFSFSIFFLPVITKSMGDLVFVSSGLISLVLIFMFILALSHFSPNRYWDNRIRLALTVSGLFIFINFLYFANIIPPIPLSLKVGGVYHYIDKKPNGTYSATLEVDNRWYKDLVRKTLRTYENKPLYVFSSVFAPTDLDTTIIHDWQYFDTASNKWVSVTKIPFNIVGGRENGYRVFSKKDNLSFGKWRVDIKTERGQVIGRVRFNIELGLPRFGLKEVTL